MSYTKDKERIQCLACPVVFELEAGKVAVLHLCYDCHREALIRFWEAYNAA